MKYCTHCGKEIEDEAVVCVHCGCATNDNKAKPQNNSLGKVALVFMILGCVFMPISIWSKCFDYFETAETIIVGIIGLIFGCLPLAWCIPMTVHYSRKYKNGESVGTGFKVCTLLFVSLVAGILLLCIPKDNQQNNQL